MKSVLGFGLLAVLGAALLACSDDPVEEVDKPSDTPLDSGLQEPEVVPEPEADGGPQIGSCEPTELMTDLEPPEIDFVGEGVECGGTRCQNVAIAEYNLDVMGCCVDAASDACGLDMTTLGIFFNLSKPGCELLDRPGSPDSSCPGSGEIAVVLPNLGPLSMPGCCQENGKCGYAADLQGLGFGCVSPTRFGRDEGKACSCTP